MSAADLFAILAFFTLLLLGLFLMTVQNALRQRPAGRVRSRLSSQAEQARPGKQQVSEDLSRAQREARRRRHRQSMGWLGHYLGRTEVVAGRRGVYMLVMTTMLLFLVAVLLAWLALPLPWWGKPVLTLALPFLGALFIYGRLNERYRVAFLAQLPDILDMIIRASQAGVPVTQSIRNVGDAFQWPAGPEFKRIGDSLHLGNDMTVVLDEAEERIRLPDFSFLSVCLMLQRETGGSLSETLSNLATVIRSRRDLRLKTRALTAEGRLSGTIISIIPLFIVGVLWMINPDYISVLFDTETGNKMLMVAVVMLVVGVLMIRKIAKLEV